jgi:hypothetical protein
MSSKRNIRRKACAGKQPLTQTGAYLVARKMRAKYGGAISGYHCDFCGHWHVGHAPARNKQAMWRRLESVV